MERQSTRKSTGRKQTLGTGCTSRKFHSAWLEHVAPDRTKHAFAIRILSGGTQRDHDFFEAHVGDAFTEALAVDSLAISEEVDAAIEEGVVLDKHVASIQFRSADFPRSRPPSPEEPEALAMPE